MRKIFLFTILLIGGMAFSQLMGFYIPEIQESTTLWVRYATMIALSFVMVHVGLEFDINKNRLGEYGKDYLVAFITATFPWLFCTFYFVYSFSHAPELTTEWIWKESLLLGRFAAPTSAGVLFTMLAAAGLAGTWVFKKARILAIFDDLDTIILLVPLKVAIVGFRWELGIVLFIIITCIWAAWHYLHRVKIPFRWKHVLVYAFILATFSELVYFISSGIEGMMALHLEVLLPAFALGCIIAYPKDDPEEVHHTLNTPQEAKASLMISAIFMFLVGANMPPVMGIENAVKAIASLPTPQATALSSVIIAGLPLNMLLWHVLVLTILSNIGKMAPIFFYKDLATLRERIALALSMCPRGEVGAGIIVVSLSMLNVIEESLIIVAMLTLALNLILTGPLIMTVKVLLSSMERKNTN